MPATPAQSVQTPLRFIDLFCGIGGFRLAFERTGAHCVFSSDWDKYSRLTYAANFGETPHGDIHAVPIPSIPSHDNLWAYLQAYAKKHQDAGNGFGFGLVTGASTTRTLSARYHKDDSEILVSQGPGKNPRRLTPRECARLMGYPDTFKITVSDTHAYRQFGNSVDPSRN
jgi:site-specific DNA-cytosine methylase